MVSILSRCPLASPSRQLRWITQVVVNGANFAISRRQITPPDMTRNLGVDLHASRPPIYRDEESPWGCRIFSTQCQLDAWRPPSWGIVQFAVRTVRRNNGSVLTVTHGAWVRSITPNSHLSEWQVNGAACRSASKSGLLSQAYKCNKCCRLQLTIIYTVSGKK